MNPQKYLQVAKINWKAMLAYQVDAWLGSASSGFRVLLSLLLWIAVFSGKEEVGGYTLPMMVTYSLLATLFARLQYADDMAYQLANEVRDGQFSKYLVHPVSVSGYFIWSGMGRWLYYLIINGAALALWSLVFSRWLAPPAPVQDLLWLLLLLPLGALVMQLLYHCIGLLSLKYIEVTGFLIGSGSLVEFLSGSLIPLSLLPAPVTAGLRFFPFYYVVYYPATLVLGKNTEPPYFAALVLLAWCLVFYVIAETWFRRARRLYEGVGI